MSDLKEFLEKKAVVIQKKQLGLFFWERGGKQFVEYILDDIDGEETIYENKLNSFIELAKEGLNNFNLCSSDNFGDSNNIEVHLWAKDFLDCLACLGEDKVKELIEGLK